MILANLILIYLYIIQPGVHPYWVGDLDNIILRNLDLYGKNGSYGNKKCLSQQLEVPNNTTQVIYVHF